MRKFVITALSATLFSFSYAQVKVDTTGAMDNLNIASKKNAFPISA